MTTMRVGVDIDDVLFPWYDLAHEVCTAAGITNGVTPTTWEPYKDYDCPEHVWLEAVIEMVPRGYYLREPIPGAVEALNDLYATGREIHLVTSRGGFSNGLAIKAATIEWLEKFEVPHHGLHFTQDKTLVRTDVLIDDHVRHIEAATGVGLSTIIVDRPYNQGFTHPLAYRVATVREAVDHLLRVTS